MTKRETAVDVFFFGADAAIFTVGGHVCSILAVMFMVARRSKSGGISSRFLTTAGWCRRLSGARILAIASALQQTERLEL